MDDCSRIANATKRQESSLIERVRQGNKELFTELVRPYVPLLKLVMYSMLRNQADVEEVMQQTMMRALTGLFQLKNEENFKNWLVQIARNESLTWQRKSRKYLYTMSLPETDQQDEASEAQVRDFTDPHELPSEIFEHKEFRTAVALALESLSEKSREIFLLHDIRQLTIAKVARLLDISIPAATSRLHRARRHIRQQLLAFCSSPDMATHAAGKGQSRQTASSPDGKQLNIRGRPDLVSDQESNQPQQRRAEPGSNDDGHTPPGQVA